MVGLDVLNTGAGFFQIENCIRDLFPPRSKEMFMLLQKQVLRKNVYQKNGYDAKANGPFVKLGAFYMLAKDAENEFNGFYAGGKVAGSFYNQEYMAIPVRGFGGSNSSEAFPSSSQSSFGWRELLEVEYSYSALILYRCESSAKIYGIHYQAG